MGSHSFLSCYFKVIAGDGDGNASLIRGLIVEIDRFYPSGLISNTPPLSQGLGTFSIIAKHLPDKFSVLDSKKGIWVTVVYMLEFALFFFFFWHFSFSFRSPFLPRDHYVLHFWKGNF